jgi:hypothetical protein
MYAVTGTPNKAPRRASIRPLRPMCFAVGSPELSILVGSRKAYNRLGDSAR